ncbi:MAG: hypothetical protein K6B68_06615 [Eubacterium sp.]|nr:hypothetical protein [Eubacterium sp.]
MLRYLSENGMIDLTITAKQIVMQRRRDILSEHPYTIWQSSDGYWKTKLKGDDGKKYQIKRRNRSDIEDAVIEYYRLHSVDNYKFKARYNMWVERQRDCGRSDNTILKYQ